MEIVKMKQVSVKSFVLLGFSFGIILGVVGVIVKLILPLSNVSISTPFFSYSATYSVLGLISYFVSAVLFITIDFFLLAIVLNAILKIIKGIEIYVEKEN